MQNIPPDNLSTVGVLLVNYRQWDLTEKCVRSLFDSRGVRVLAGLVDNGYPEDIPGWVENTPGLFLLRNTENLGLTAGNNQAYEMLSPFSPDFVLVLNNDTEVEPETLARLAGYLASNPAACIAAPAVTFASSPTRIWSAGGKFSRWRMRLHQTYRTLSDLPDEPVVMRQVTGCAMMMSWTDYARAGMQDPDLFVYYEDTDLCFKVERLGGSIHLVPGAVVAHHVSISVGGVLSPFAVYFTHRNRAVVALRHLSPLERFAFLVYYLFVTLVKTVAYPLRRRGCLVRWMWLGTIHGLANRPRLRPSALFRRKESR
jgi:GT2 family glycosyltransferase